jgi:hypothetical protein
MVYILIRYIAVIGLAIVIWQLLLLQYIDTQTIMMFIGITMQSVPGLQTSWLTNFWFMNQNFTRNCVWFTNQNSVNEPSIHVRAHVKAVKVCFPFIQYGAWVWNTVHYILSLSSLWSFLSCFHAQKRMAAEGVEFDDSDWSFIIYNFPVFNFFFTFIAILRCQNSSLSQGSVPFQLWLQFSNFSINFS